MRHSQRRFCPAVIDWLGMLSKVRTAKERKGLRALCNGYESIHGFLLKEGRAMTYQPKPAHLPWGFPGQCYDNARKLSTRFPGLTYCEGFATGIIPTEHAWCVDELGYVVDNTWDPSNVTEQGREYFGVRIKLSYVLAHRMEVGHNSIVGAWDHAFPITRAPRTAWDPRAL